MIKDNLKLRGDVSIVLKSADGSVKDSRAIKNLVVNDGLNFIVSRMKDTTQGAMSHMAVGSALLFRRTLLHTFPRLKQEMALERLQRQEYSMRLLLAICFAVVYFRS